MAQLHRVVRNLEATGRNLQQVVDRLRRLAEAEELRHLAAHGPAAVSAAQVRGLIAARKLWRECIGQTMGRGGGEGDPAWALLMELFALRLEGRPVTVGALGEAAGLTPSTTLRRLAALESARLIARRPDPEDDRTILVSLTDEADDRLRAYLLGAMRLSPWVL